MRRGVSQRQHFERRPHFGHFLDFIEAEAGDAHATARLARHQPLRFQAAKRFTHRHMARAEFLGDALLAELAEPASMAPEMMRSASARAIRTAIGSSFAVVMIL